LNQRYKMEDHNGHYLTMWYGVYQLSTQRLTYAGAGHPPALVVQGSGPPLPLWSGSPPVGMFSDIEFTAATHHVAEGSQILIYSDGAFEFRLPFGDRFTLAGFVTLCAELTADPQWDLDGLIDILRSHTAADQFDDDCTMIKLQFGEPYSASAAPAVRGSVSDGSIRP
jgi:sigma-B regulation protein RsbU (phosphoserine phosphatase)